MKIPGARGSSGNARIKHETFVNAARSEPWSLPHKVTRNGCYAAKKNHIRLQDSSGSIGFGPHPGMLECSPTSVFDLVEPLPPSA